MSTAATPLDKSLRRARMNLILQQMNALTTTARALDEHPGLAYQPEALATVKGLRVRLSAEYDELAAQVQAEAKARMTAR